MRAIRRFCITVFIFGSTLEATGEDMSDLLSKSVGNCWNLDLNSKSAEITLTISADLRPNGTVVIPSIELVSYEGGSGRDVTEAFKSARRALIRCQQNGYPLPTEKYDQWRKLEIKFNPSWAKRH